MKAKIIILFLSICFISAHVKASCGCSCAAIVYHNGTPSYNYFAPPYTGMINVNPMDSVQLAIFRDPDCGYEVHTWTKDGNYYTSNMGNHSVINVYEDGLYQCAFTCNSVSLNFSIQVSFTTTGINLSEEKLELNIHPNPFSDAFTIDVSSKKPQKFSYSIYNLLGEEVKSYSSNDNTIYTIKHEVHFENLSKGIYLIRITLGDRSLNKLLSHN